MGVISKSVASPFLPVLLTPARAWLKSVAVRHSGSNAVFGGIDGVNFKGIATTGFTDLAGRSYDVAFPALPAPVTRVTVAEDLPGEGVWFPHGIVWYPVGAGVTVGDLSGQIVIDERETLEQTLWYLPFFFADVWQDLLGEAGNHPLHGTPREVFDEAPAPYPNWDQAVQTEFFQIYFPSGYASTGTPWPVVYAHNGITTTEAEIRDEGIRDAADRLGCVLLSCRGIDRDTWSTDLQLRHVEACIRWALDNFNLDADRIYGIGYSKGCQTVASFAAKYRDPNGIVMAAVCGGGATFDLVYWHLKNDPATSGVPWEITSPFEDRKHLERTDICNGVYTAAVNAIGLRYRVAGPMHLDPATYAAFPVQTHTTGTVDKKRSVGMNLARVPCWFYDDPTDNWPAAVQVGFPAGMTPFLGAKFTDAILADSVGAKDCRYTLTTNPNPENTGHNWDILPFDELLAWMLQYRAERYPPAFNATLHVNQATTGAASAAMSWITVTPTSVHDTMAVGCAISEAPGSEGFLLVAPYGLASIYNVAKARIDATNTPIADMSVDINVLATGNVSGTLYEIVGLGRVPTGLTEVVPGIDNATIVIGFDGPDSIKFTSNGTTVWGLINF